MTALDQNLEKLDADEIFAGMRKITSLVGDGHTSIYMPLDLARFPLVVGQFGNEYRVIRVAPGLETALGARVVKIRETPISRVRQLLSVPPLRLNLPGIRTFALSAL